MNKLFCAICLITGLNITATWAVHAQQSLDATLWHDGLLRQYKLYVPAAYNPNQAVPLLFNLHGYSSNNEEQTFYADFRPIADTANFIICHPNGTPDPTGNLFWNVGFDFTGTNIDDEGFLMALLDTLSTQYQIDPRRVSSTGMSNGGYMSYSLACTQTDRIAAIASVTGSMTNWQINNCQPSRPIPILQIHGTADPVVPYTGGPYALHIDSLVSYWKHQNGCGDMPTAQDLPNLNLADNCTATRYTYTNCDAGSQLELYRIEGGAHTWPGSIINFAGTCQDFSASVAIWQFLRLHALPESLNILPSTPINPTLSGVLVPNPASRGNTVLRWHLPHSISGGQPPIWSLYDAQGNLITRQIAQTEQNIDTDQLPSGIYWVTLQHPQAGFWQQKLLVCP